MARDLVVQELKSLLVAPDGAAFRLGLRDLQGKDAGVIFPSDAIRALLLSLFRAGDTAFKRLLNDDSARLVYPAVACTLEALPGTGRVMLIMRSDDGFEAAFAIDPRALSTCSAEAERLSEPSRAVRSATLN